MNKIENFEKNMPGVDPEDIFEIDNSCFEKNESKDGSKNEKNIKNSNIYNDYIELYCLFCFG